MQNDTPQVPVAPSEDFGMSEQDVKNYKLQSIWNKVKYFFAQISPAISKILNAFIYYSIKFVKAVVIGVFRMITGKEV